MDWVPFPLLPASTVTAEAPWDHEEHPRATGLGQGLGDGGAWGPSRPSVTACQGKGEVGDRDNQDPTCTMGAMGGIEEELAPSLEGVWTKKNCLLGPQLLHSPLPTTLVS